MAQGLEMTCIRTTMWWWSGTGDDLHQDVTVGDDLVDRSQDDLVDDGRVGGVVPDRVQDDLHHADLVVVRMTMWWMTTSRVS